MQKVSNSNSFKFIFCSHYLSNFNYVQIFAQVTCLGRCLCCRAVGDSTENYGLLEMFGVGHGAHALVAHTVEALAEWGVFDCDPAFLVQ